MLDALARSHAEPAARRIPATNADAARVGEGWYGEIDRALERCLVIKRSRESGAGVSEQGHVSLRPLSFGTRVLLAG